MPENKFLLLSFDNTHNAIKTKKKLNNIIEYRTIPTLREISASCGISLRLECTLYKLLNIIESKKIDKSLFSIYEIIENSQTHDYHINLISDF